MARDFDLETSQLQKYGIAMLTNPTVTELVELTDRLALDGEDVRVSGVVQVRVDASSRSTE